MRFIRFTRNDEWFLIPTIKIDRLLGSITIMWLNFEFGIGWGD